MTNIKYLIMDVDGTLTDGKIYMSATGEMIKAFNIKDGYGIHDLLIPSGVIPVIITGRESAILEKRCKELGVNMVFQNISNKLALLKSVAIFNNLENVAYIGDDDNDLPCMMEIKKAGGIIGCPGDASKKIKKVVNFVSSMDGGAGAVRDFIEWILEKNK